MPKVPPLILAALLAACLPPAHAQVSARERLQITGTVEAVAGDRVTVRNDQGERVEVRVHRKGEQGVQLADGRLRSFPAEVRIGGGFDGARLKPGQVVRFEALLNAAGRSDGEVRTLTLVDADAAEAAVGAVDLERHLHEQEHVGAFVEGAGVGSGGVAGVDAGFDGALALGGEGRLLSFVVEE